jgi:hypothetical protein
MTTGTRLQLKQPTGWFAAGREIACALQLLSDATFKVFLWLCLHAERSRGAMPATPAEIAKAIGKAENEIRACLQELQRQGVCVVEAGVIQITDAFWPYRRSSVVSSTEQERRYVDEVKRLFLERRCVQSSFTAADERLARSLYRRGLSLAHVEQAILLGAARKYLFIAQHGTGTPITSLHYFTNVFEEVQQNTLNNYWTYIAHKVKTFEQTWNGLSAPNAQETTPARQKGGTCGSTVLSEIALKPS